MLYFLKLFEEMYTKYKPLIIVVFFMMATFSAYNFYSSIDKYGSLLRETTDLLRETKAYLIKNEIRLTNVEQEVDENREIIRHIVTREDFNAHEARKDNEMMKQMEFNSKISEQIGYVSGQIFVLEKKFEAINNNE